MPALAAPENRSVPSFAYRAHKLTAHQACFLLCQMFFTEVASTAPPSTYLMCLPLQWWTSQSASSPSFCVAARCIKAEVLRWLSEICTTARTTQKAHAASVSCSGRTMMPLRCAAYPGVPPYAFRLVWPVQIDLHKIRIASLLFTSMCIHNCTDEIRRKRMVQRERFCHFDKKFQM